MISKMNKSSFEDLSNELLYDIFDFLDDYFVYMAFSNLNGRFQCLIADSSLLLKINLSNISKSVLERRCKDILTPNVHRIGSITVSNSLAIDHFLKISPIDISFNRLESLTLDKIKVKKLVSLLPDLALLPRLFSLSMMPTDTLPDEGIIYQLLFRLPVLKYGKFHSGQFNQSFTLPIAANKQEQCLSLRYLVIRCIYDLSQLVAILSYTPLLSRLKCQFINESVNVETDRPIVLSNITHISLYLWHSSFAQLQSFMGNYFPKLEVLRIETENDNAYLDANRWERLITHRLPHLRIFNFQYSSRIKDEDNVVFHAQIDQFSSRFWHERKWFFAHEHYSNHNKSGFILFSTQSYRTNSYALRKSENNSLCSSRYHHLNLTKHLIIRDYQAVTSCSLQFPRIIYLTITHNLIRCVDLHRMISWPQLNILSIECDPLPVDMLLDFLHHAFNVRSLTLSSKPHLPLSVEQMKKVSLISQNNKITNLYVQAICALEHFRFFTDLCPRLEHLNTGVQANNSEFILRDVLLTNTRTSGHLCSLSLWSVYDDEAVSKLRAMINNEKLLNDYSIECIHGAVRLWW